MKFSVELKKIKVRELLDAESDIPHKQVLMSRFMLDDQSDPIDPDKAIEILMDLDLEEWEKAQLDFLEAMQSATTKDRR